MLIQLTRRVGLRIARPVWLEVARAPQLELRLPEPPPTITLNSPPAGYCLRTYRTDDEAALLALFARAGFRFDSGQLQAALLPCLPHGCFVVVDEATGRIVSTMMARHLAAAEHPLFGRIDWLATDPDHRHKGLGEVCARHATGRLLDAGFERIHVTTDDARLGAIKIFLAIGFCAYVTPETRERWRVLEEQLGRGVS